MKTMLDRGSKGLWPFAPVVISVDRKFGFMSGSSRSRRAVLLEFSWAVAGQGPHSQNERGAVGCCCPGFSQRTVQSALKPSRDVVP